MKSDTDPTCKRPISLRLYQRRVPARGRRLNRRSIRDIRASAETDGQKPRH
jgi:hypothetical protein